VSRQDPMHREHMSEVDVQQPARVCTFISFVPKGVA
jgi:hypothetical protein